MSSDIMLKADQFLANPKAKDDKVTKTGAASGKLGGNEPAPGVGQSRESAPAFDRFEGPARTGGIEDIGRNIDAYMYQYDRPEAERLGVNPTTLQSTYATTQAQRDAQLAEARAFTPTGVKGPASAETWTAPAAPVDLKDDAETKKPTGRASAALSARPSSLSAGPKASRTLLGA